MSNDPHAPIDPRAAAVTAALQVAADAVRDLGLRATILVDPADGALIRFAEPPLSHHAAMRRAVIEQRLKDAVTALPAGPALPRIAVPAGRHTGRPSTVSAFGHAVDLPRQRLPAAVTRALRLQDAGLRQPADADWSTEPIWRISHRHWGAATWVAKQVRAPDAAAAVRRTLWKEGLSSHIRGDPPIQLGAAARHRPGGWTAAEDTATAVDALGLLALSEDPLDRMLAQALTIPIPP